MDRIIGQIAADGELNEMGVYKLKDFKKLLDTEEYKFLKEHPRLGNRIMLWEWAEVMLMGRIMRTVILIFGELR